VSANSAERADRALLDEVSRGSESAFWSIWENYGNHLYGVCLRHLRGVHSDAADAVSRSMLVARNRLPYYARQIENLEAWLTRLTCNVCLDIHRERRRDARATIDLSDVFDDAYDLRAPRSLTPEDEVLQTEAYQTVASAIRGLPPRLCVVAEMRFLEDLDYEVIAERLVITEQSARKRVQQARAMLSVLLGHGVTLRAARS
jgi:RNA polymerase sigma factor (sigma-70 family)